MPKRPAISVIVLSVALVAWCLLGRCVSAQEAAPAHTAQDFMDAQDAAQKALDAVQQVLRRHGAVRASAERCI